MGQNAHLARGRVGMGIVAISQALGSRGDEIGRELARVLAWEFAGRDIILRAAEQFGESALVFEPDRRPSLWDCFTETKRHYLAYVEAVIWELAARDDVVLVGRGAVFVLRDVRHVLRLRITAPPPVRVRRVETERGLATDAATAVRQNDRERAARIKFLYDVAWDDPDRYDLVLNTERLEAEDGIGIVRAALGQPRFQPTPEALRHVRDQSLAARAGAALLANPVTRDLQLFVASENGHLTVSGRVWRDDQRRVAAEVAGAIPGIARVLNEIAVVRASSAPAPAGP